MSLVKRSRRLTTLTPSKISDASASVWCWFGPNTGKYYRMQRATAISSRLGPAWPLMRSVRTASMIQLSACTVCAVRAYFHISFYVSHARALTTPGTLFCSAGTLFKTPTPDLRRDGSAPWRWGVFTARPLFRCKSLHTGEKRELLWGLAVRLETKFGRCAHRSQGSQPAFH